MKWFGFYQGNPLGEINGVTPKDYPFIHLNGTQKSVEKVVDRFKINKDSERFQTFISDRPFRPILLSSRNEIKPSRWIEVEEVKKQLKKIGFLAFRMQFPLSINCESENSKPVEVNYKDNDIKIIRAFERIGTDEFILGIQLNGEIYKCDGPLDEIYAIKWFYFRGGKSSYVGSSMFPVDAFSLLGEELFLFLKMSYNRDGYILFNGKMKELTKVEWFYH